MIVLNVWRAQSTKEEAMSEKKNLSHIICLLPQKNGTALLIDPDGRRVELSTSEVEIFTDWMKKTKPKSGQSRLYTPGQEHKYKIRANKIFIKCIKERYNCEVKAAFLVSKVSAKDIATHKLHDEKLLSRA